MRLVLIRHGESEWNRKNLFTGWTDVDLTKTGKEEAKNAGTLLEKNHFDFDICYTSYLKRAIHTLNIILNQMDRDWLPVIKAWKLNERHYGALQGLNKSETAKKYGENQVKIWRRSFDIRPPALSANDARNPALLEQYRDVNRSDLPLCESLKDTINRVVPYYRSVIFAEMKCGKWVLIAAHGNSIRALVKTFDDLSDKEIMEINIPTGIPLVYEFNETGAAIKKYYLGDDQFIRAKISEVANQGNAVPANI